MGFPTRPNRAAFGPDYENERPVTDVKREIGAGIFNLSFWQLAGLSRVAPRAILVASVSGGAVTTTHQMLAWDPNGELPLLAWTYDGVGEYSVALDDQYPDEQGTDVDTALVGGLAGAMGTVAAFPLVELSSDHEATVYFFDAAGSAADPDSFIVCFW